MTRSTSRIRKRHVAASNLWVSCHNCLWQCIWRQVFLGQPCHKSSEYRNNHWGICLLLPLADTYLRANIPSDRFFFIHLFYSLFFFGRWHTSRLQLALSFATNKSHRLAVGTSYPSSFSLIKYLSLCNSKCHSLHRKCIHAINYCGISNDGLYSVWHVIQETAMNLGDSLLIPESLRKIVMSARSSSPSSCLHWVFFWSGDVVLTYSSIFVWQSWVTFLVSFMHCQSTPRLTFGYWFRHRN